MALITTRLSNELAAPFVLAPERYDPRRELDNVGKVTIASIAALVRKVVAPGGIDLRCSVFDTSDAREGVITALKPIVDSQSIGSTKKQALPGDVVISRLRPYLRQVAYIDQALVADTQPGLALLFSTEFFVLRSKATSSIAFLVPFLLSAPVQRVLEAAQEGGHHPRVNEETILNLPVPESVLVERDSISRQVEDAVAMHRQSVNKLSAMVAQVGQRFATDETEVTGANIS